MSAGMSSALGPGAPLRLFASPNHDHSNLKGTTMSTRCTAINPTTSLAEFTFILSAATEIATNAYADGANEHPGGYNAYLLRTARGRWVWEENSLWQGDPSTTYVAATTAAGKPINQSEVEKFLSRFGDDAAVALWREDIKSPLPLA